MDALRPTRPRHPRRDDSVPRAQKPKRQLPDRGPLTVEILTLDMINRRLGAAYQEIRKSRAS